MLHTSNRIHVIIRRLFGLIFVVSDSDSPVLIIRLLRVRIRYDDDFTQNLIQLVSSSLFVSSPLDENVETQSLDYPSGILPGGLLQKLIISRVSMSDMCNNGKLDPPGQWHIITQAYRFGALIYRRLCSSQLHAITQVPDSVHPYQVERMYNYGLTVRVRDTREQIEDGCVGLGRVLGLRRWQGFGLAVGNGRLW